MKRHKRSIEIEGQHDFEPTTTIEQTLIIAIIERAVLDLELTDRMLWLDAYQWLMSRDTGEWSFLWCCNQLDMEADVFYAKLKQAHV